MTAIVLNLKPFVELSDDQFYQLCQNHRDLKFEGAAQGDLLIVSPVDCSDLLDRIPKLLL